MYSPVAKYELVGNIFRSLKHLLVAASIFASGQLYAMESASKLFGSESTSESTEASSTPTTVVLETSMGTIELQLFDSEAPLSVANFLQYVNESYYDGTQFHRVIDGFMVQGGGFTADMSKKPTRAPIQNEADNGLLNTVGTIAMARTNAPHSATSQFFINVVDNAFLNHRGKMGNQWGYTVFGKVGKGMDVVEAIKVVPTATRSGHANVPVEPVLINKAYVKQ